MGIGWRYPSLQNQQQGPGSPQKGPVYNTSNPDHLEILEDVYGNIGHDEYDGQVPSQGVCLDAQYWQRQPVVDTRRVTIADDVSEVTSHTEVHRESFLTRNRGGHGNILTWGNDSRSITPVKKRQGRQITVDPEYGVPRSHLSSEIFERN